MDQNSSIMEKMPTRFINLRIYRDLWRFIDLWKLVKTFTNF